MVTPQNWLFLTTYKHLRKRLLSESQWDLVARLGEHAFESDAAAGAFVALVCITRQAPAPGHELHSTAGSDTGESSAKAMALRTGQLQSAFQSLQVSNPDSRVTVEVEPGLTRLSDFADSYLGLGTCDAEHYVRVYWEFPTLPKHWAFMQVADRTSARVGGFEHVVAWDSERRRVHGMTQEERRQGHNQDYRGSSAWGSAGVAIGLIRELRPSPYFGELFDKSLAVLIPKKPEYLPAIARYSTSRAFTSQVRRLDQKVMVTNSTLVKVPFDLAAWAHHDETSPFQSRANVSNQWMFDGTPVSSDSPLNIAVILSAGYRWPRDNGLSFREYPAVCHCAPRDFAELDGLLCLHSVADKASAEAIVRNVLSASYGSQWSANRLTSLLNGYSSLQSWLLESFFQEHCRLFLDVPFIWHIWDGQIDGFHAFVNYHKLAAPNGQGRKTLERLTYTLLNDWILRQRSEVERKVDGAETRLAAAIHLQSELKKILEGEPPYDIFARWKPLHEQPIGWEPDINDGVRINIRPFLNAKPYRGSRNSCILRIMPKIKHGKDRGKEPWRPKGDYPWFWSWDERTPDFNGGDTFDGARWNDLHYSNEIKRKARAKKAEADASKS